MFPYLFLTSSTKPSLPTGPPAVGGVAGLLDEDDSAATSAPGGRTTGYIAALAGIVGAALIAGGWYVRRRWLR